MAKEKMSQTQTSTKYAEPPIKINRALYGVLLASLIVRNCSGHFEFVLIAPAFVGCFFVSEGIARYCTQRH